jgi:hypothetical protein
MGLHQVLTNQRLQGISAILAHMKQLAVKEMMNKVPERMNAVNSMPQITVIKQDLEGCETWRYTGKTLERGENFILLEAKFNRADTPFHDIILKQGDRFVERFYTDRWYNIFEIHDREDDQLKDGTAISAIQPSSKMNVYLISTWLWTYWYIQMAGSKF